MELSVTVVGAAAVTDYIYSVARLPNPGEIVPVLEHDQSGRYCGGSAPNTACALARMGSRTRLMYPVGKDFPGSECERNWKRFGVDLSNLTILPDRRSGFACLFFIPGGETVCFAYPGAAQYAGPPAEVTLSPTVVIGPVFNSFTSPLLEGALGIGRRVVISGISSTDLLPFLSRVSALVINRKEARTLCQAAGTGQIRSMVKRFPDLQLFVTQGDQGSTLYYQDDEYPVPPIKASQVTDPTGAGDAYTAGVVAGLVRGLEPHLCAFLGAACASFVVERFGAQSNLPSLDEVLDRLKSQALEPAGEISAHLSRTKEEGYDEDEG